MARRLSHPLRLLIPMVLCASTSLARADSQPAFAVKADMLSIRANGQAAHVSLRSPTFSIHDAKPVGDAAPLGTKGSIAEGQSLEVLYAPIALTSSSTLETKLLLTWSQAQGVLRKRGTFRLAGPQGTRVLKEVVLDRIDVQGRKVWTHGSGAPGEDSPMLLDSPQSHPVFMPGIFFGIEFPVASTRHEDGKIVLAHRSGLKMQPGVWYETRTAIYGIAPAGEEVRAFQRYVASHRPKPRGCHVNYNSWWTSPVLYTEADILGLMKTFEDKLSKTHGVGFDTFAIDAGWSNAKSVWEIEPKRFPRGLGPLCDAAKRMQANLGLWISPSSCYPFALDGDWAKSQGFESLTIPNAGDPKSKVRLLCLGGKRYAEQFKTRLADMVARYGIHHVKLDGYVALCPEEDHGHEPGELSAEAIAEGLIGAVAAARRANPNLWAEATCFGYNPSPWWLWHVNSVIGTFGDDAPVGRIPSPIYRESYTSARDYFNLQGAALLPIPAGAQEVLGIIHQTPEPLTNDSVMTVMRGHQFLPLYVNPKFMTDGRWKALADLLKWARANADLLGQTVPLLPRAWQKGKIPRFSDKEVMPREPYGYAHVRGDVGVVALRNPWIAPQSYAIRLDGRTGFSSAAIGLSVVSLYPEPRVYAAGLKFGEALEVPLAPYETVVLSIKSQQPPPDSPRAALGVRSHVKLVKCDHRLQRVAFSNSREWLGPDWTCLLGDVTSAVQLTFDAQIDVAAPQAELLILCEGKKPPVAPVGRVKVNGREVQTGEVSSATGWSATMLPTHEHWTFLRVPLVSGSNAIAMDEFVGDDCTTISAWVWATKVPHQGQLNDLRCRERPPWRSGTGQDAPHSAPRNATEGVPYSGAPSLPKPELISLDGAEILAATDIAGLPKKAVAADRPVERIDGVFLDVLQPVSVTQGYGTLQKNRSVWEKPMTIAGKRFLRGLGTHAPSRIVYALDGKYRRFQTWAGADGATWPTIAFEVWIDGVKKWESGPVARDIPPIWVDLDVANAKKLELVVGDCGDFAGDHANWAEARLLTRDER